MSTPFRTSASARKPNAASTGCLRAFFGIFFVAGMAVIYLITIRPLLQVVGALRWAEVPCVVDSSRVAVHPSRKGGATYSIEVVYHYDFRGRPYTSKRFLFATGSTAGRNRKQQVVDQYPPGTRTVCYVNPDAPSEAVIDRGPNVEMGFGAFGLIFVAVGGAGMFFAGRISRTQHTPPRNAVPQLVPASGELITLKPQATPLGKFLGMLVFAILWNGFLSIFFYLTFLAHDRSSVPIFAKIFVGFFCLIGLLIIAGVFGSFLALFNPRVRLTARTGCVPLGGEFQFQWSFAGRPEKLRNLRIVMEGREEAVWRSGKSVETKTQVFAEIPIIETADREIIAQGQGRVTIPAGLMHTFHGRYNKIAWRLRVRGELAHVAPIEEDYPVDVLPRNPMA